MEQLSKYEEARIVGARALQLAMGAPFTLKLSEKDLEQIKYNPVEIAKREYKEGLVPMTVKRPIPHSAKNEEKPEAA